jgi:hypothetical protein
VVEDLLDPYDEGQLRPVTCHHQLVEERRLRDQDRRAVDPQRVAATGHQVDQADVRVTEQITEPVDARITGTVRQGERAIVQHERRARRIASGPDVAGPVRRRGGDQAQQ